jgi:hypothetical protein
MKKPAFLALCVTLLLFLAVSTVSALGVPERLVYEVSWSGITAGSAVQEVTAKEGELHIVYTVRSFGLINTFFSIDDRSESVLARVSASDPLGRPRLFREKIKEGKTHTEKEALFDQSGLKVETKDFLKNTEKTDPISARTHDTLSSVYFIRSSELAPGKSIHIDIFDCKRLWNAEVRVLKREELSTKLGNFQTLVVATHLKAEGVKPRPDYMTVWLSDDSRRIPVKMVIKMKMGEFTAQLVGGSYWP